MDKLSSLSKFKTACPYLGRTKSNTLRTLCTSASPRYPTLSKLTEKAALCPVMGQALTARSSQMVAGYASLAGSAEFNKIPEHHNITSTAADAAKCPHASKAIAAARMAEELASAKKGKAPKTSVAAAAKAAHAAPSGCPFHAQANAARAASTSEVKPKAAAIGGFDYEKFYAEELDKKHKDASYRYFNNINRMANKFPVAHTGDPKDEVEVWCANDYLGMGNNPVVLEMMQCVPMSSTSSRLFLLIGLFSPDPQSHSKHIWSRRGRYPKHSRQYRHASCPRGRACVFAPQARCARLLVVLRCQRCDAHHLGFEAAWMRLLLRQHEPRVHDPRHASLWR